VVSARPHFVYGSSFANAILLDPEETLAFDTTYRVRLGTGVRDIEGRALSAPIVSRFRTRCADDRLGDCLPLPEPWTEPSGPPAGDAGPRPDASVESDAGEDDAGTLPIDAGADVTPVPSCGCSAIGASDDRRLAWLASVLLAAALVRRRR
jgi:MYXO-CTERM domain-containing protein